MAWKLIPCFMFSQASWEPAFSGSRAEDSCKAVNDREQTNGATVYVYRKEGVFARPNRGIDTHIPRPHSFIPAPHPLCHSMFPGLSYYHPLYNTVPPPPSHSDNFLPSREDGHSLFPRNEKLFPSSSQLKSLRFWFPVKLQTPVPQGDKPEGKA